MSCLRNHEFFFFSFPLFALSDFLNEKTKQCKLQFKNKNELGKGRSNGRRNKRNNKNVCLHIDAYLQTETYEHMDRTFMYILMLCCISDLKAERCIRTSIFTNVAPLLFLGLIIITTQSPKWFVGTSVKIIM